MVLLFHCDIETFTTCVNVAVLGDFEKITGGARAERGRAGAWEGYVRQSRPGAGAARRRRMAGPRMVWTGMAGWVTRGVRGKGARAAGRAARGRSCAGARAAEGETAGGTTSLPDCQSSTICSSRAKRRARQAMIKACSAAGSQPWAESDSTLARRLPNWSAREEG